MKPYYERDGLTTYHGDCRAILLQRIVGKSNLKYLELS